jgi:hypothetical protein
MSDIEFVGYSCLISESVATVQWLDFVFATTLSLISVTFELFVGIASDILIFRVGAAGDELC